MDINKKRNKAILITLVIVFIILALSGTYYIANSFSKNSKIEEEKITDNNIEKDEVKIPNDDSFLEEETKDDKEVRKELTKEQINNNPNALIASYVTKFFDINYDNDDTEEYEWLKYKKDGSFYGFEDWHWLGCSKFCCVEEATETANSSSTLESQGTISYTASNLVNSIRKNAWIEGVEGNGIGESVNIETKVKTISLNENESFNFSGLVIVNGYAKNETVWKENNRVEVLKMYYNDEFITDILLQDIMYPQYFDISYLNIKSYNNQTNEFKFEIASVYKGTTYDDTAITGINIDFDIPCH